MNNSQFNLAFFGTPAFASRGLQALLEMPELKIGLVVTQPDSPAGRGQKLQQSAVKALALKEQIPILQPASIKKKQEEFLKKFESFGPFDLAVVIAYGQILPAKLLSAPKHGCLNVHASLLPRWRGAAPIQRAILADDRQSGISLMRMEAGLDNGPVYSSSSLSISDNEDFQSLHDKLAELGSALLKRDLLKILNGTSLAEPQDEKLVTYASKISPEECEINWKRDAFETARQIRALCPFPGAFSFLNDKRLKIFKAHAAVSETAGLMPGSVAYIDQSRLEINCGKNVLCITEAQLEGRRRMPIDELLRGATINSSSVLGKVL